MRGSRVRAAWSLAVLGIALAGCARKPGVPLEMLTWDRDFPPHRVAGNVYFVGRKNVGIFLITTPAGHILLDSGFEASVPAVQASVQQLGFRFQDIKYLLASHAHVDHVQGHARVRQLTGARVLASEQDAPYIRSGGQDDPAFGNRYRWTPCPVDQIVRDGDTVSLGGTVLTARLTPGHTPGATTWTMPVDDRGKRLQVVFFPSANVLPGTRLVGNIVYPQIAADFDRSFATWRALSCDVFLGAHGVFYGLDDKYPRLAQAGDRGGVNPFIDPEGFRQTVADMEKTFRARLESQQ
jgi:metallo-beta-lactamase class B